MNATQDRIPVTLLTGFLGAGKTTLLNQLIQNPDAGRIAVIMNEFGDVGLDHDLIEDVTGDIVLLHAGCLCCSIRGDLAKTLILLLSRLRRGELNFDRVVIETTGIADPGPIINTMVTDELISVNFQLDGVVVLADAAAGPKTLDAQFEAVAQVATADLLVVTKSDLVSGDVYATFETRLRGLNDRARLVRADHGRVAAEALFGLSAMRPDASSSEVSDWLGDRTLQMHEDHRHHRIESASIEIAQPIPASVFDFWLDSLLAMNGPDILRMKGIVHVQGMSAPFVFHGVQHIFDKPVPLTTWSGEDTKSRVVLIARDMEKAALEASLQILLGREENPLADVDAAMAM